MMAWEAFCRDACAAHAKALADRPQQTNQLDAAAYNLYRFGCRSSTTIAALLQLLAQHPHDPLLHPVLELCTDEWRDYRCSLHSHPDVHARCFQHQEPDPWILGEYSDRVFANVTVGNLYDNQVWNVHPQVEQPTLLALQRAMRRYEARECAAAGKVSLADQRLQQPIMQRRAEALDALPLAHPPDHIQAVEHARDAMLTKYQGVHDTYEQARAPTQAVIAEIEAALKGNWGDMVRTSEVKREPDGPLPEPFRVSAMAVLPVTTDTDAEANVTRVKIEQQFPLPPAIDQAHVDSAELRAFILARYRCTVWEALCTITSQVVPIITRVQQVRPIATEALRVLHDDLRRFQQAAPTPIVPPSVYHMRQRAIEYDRMVTARQVARGLPESPGRGWKAWHAHLHYPHMVLGKMAEVVVNAENQVMRAMELETVRIDGTRTAPEYITEYTRLLEGVRDRLQTHLREGFTRPIIASPVSWSVPAQPWFVDADVWAQTWRDVFASVEPPTGAVKSLHYAAIQKAKPQVGAPQPFVDIAQAWLALWALVTLS